MKLVYIAGPYTAPTLWEQESNVRMSKRVALELARFRIPFFSPVCHSAMFEHYLGDGDPGYNWWVEYTLDMLTKCDALFLVPGWENSRGATGEFNYAHSHNMPIFSEYDELLDWWNDQEIDNG